MYRAQVEINFACVELCLNHLPSARRQRLSKHSVVGSYTSPGCQGLTFDEQVLSLPLNANFFKRFHLDARRLLNLCIHTLNATMWKGDLPSELTKTVLGAQGILRTLKESFTTHANVKHVHIKELAKEILGTGDPAAVDRWLSEVTQAWIAKASAMVASVEASTKEEIEGMWACEVDEKGVLNLRDALPEAVKETITKQCIICSKTSTRLRQAVCSFNSGSTPNSASRKERADVDSARHASSNT